MSRSVCAPRLTQAVASTRGSVITIVNIANASIGTTISTQPVTTRRAHGLSAVADGSRHFHGSVPIRVGLIRW